jgi:hypothetical protein
VALLVEELGAAAEQTGGAWAAAAAARGRALLDDEAAVDGHLAAALAAHARVPMPFELARTQLTVGERLRRVRRRADARELLAAAHAAFAALGTPRWVSGRRASWPRPAAARARAPGPAHRGPTAARPPWTARPPTRPARTRRPPPSR